MMPPEKDGKPTAGLRPETDEIDPLNGLPTDKLAGMMDIYSAEEEYVSQKPSERPPGSPPVDTEFDLSMIPGAPQGRKRQVVRYWPRMPDGKTIGRWGGSDSPYGKRAGNGLLLWAESVLDFFLVQHFPDGRHLTPMPTPGSRIANWMRANGEAHFAVDEMEWADREGDPQEIVPSDVGELLRDKEKNHWLIPDDARLMNTSGNDVQGTPGAVVAPFDYQNYPKPWPLVPFSQRRPIRLEKRLPLSLLPEKIIVHDPWGVLATPTKSPDERDWTKMEDKCWTYKLQLTDAAIEKAQREREEAEARERRARSFGHDSKYAVVSQAEEDANNSKGNTSALVFFPPAAPPKPPTVPEAHLFLSPASTHGRGNHSVVFNAEWELPRSLFIDPILCETCLQESLQRDFREGTLKEFKPNAEEEKAARAMLPVVEEEKILPALDIRFTEREGLNSDRIRKGMEEFATKAFTVKPAETRRTVGPYKGPIRTFRLDAQWQSPETGYRCKHMEASCPPPPPTSVVNVAAKLSIPGDIQLKREARNYQEFPDHFFQHWNGFNLIHPIQDPVPVGALVPQFYGYYVPDKPEDDDASGDEATPPYLSPILLLEDCGKPMSPENMDRDEKNAAASLLFRFHHEGWRHGSFFERNIMCKLGPIDDFPLSRIKKRVPMFRLVDFGRSRKAGDNYDEMTARWSEENCAEYLYDIEREQYQGPSSLDEDRLDVLRICGERSGATRPMRYDSMDGL